MGLAELDCPHWNMGWVLGRVDQGEWKKVGPTAWWYGASGGGYLEMCLAPNMSHIRDLLAVGSVS